MSSRANPRRTILVISRNEQVGKWFRFALGGCKTGLPTTVTTDLGEGIKALKRLRPRVVIFVEEGSASVDDRLMLLQSLLLLEKQAQQNTLAILYETTQGRLTMYHNLRLTGVTREDVAQAAAETRSCPLFGYAEAEVPGFPDTCHFLPIMAKAAAAAATETAAKN